MRTKQPKAAEARQELDPLAVIDFESGIGGINTLIEYTEDALQQALADDGKVDYTVLAAILAMAQKAGAMIERGYGIAKGDGIGNGAGLIGNADDWMTDPSARRRRRRRETTWNEA